MRRALIVLAVAASALSAGAALGRATAPEPPYVEPLVAACVWEDGPGPCYWDADTSGNGIGDDVFVNSDGTSVTVND